MYPIWLFETILSGFIWSGVVILSIKKIFFPWWIIWCLINFLALFFYKSGMEMQDHGGINRTSFTITICVLFILYSLTKGLTSLWRYSVRLFAGLFVFLFCLLTAFYFIRVRGSCGDWTKGLGDHRLINSESQ